MTDFIPEPEDIPFEEDILRNPFNTKSWIRYLEFKSESPAQSRNMIYERALRELPGSYKLWSRYLRDRRKQVRALPLAHPGWNAANSVHERALVYMHKMPRVWEDYCSFLMNQKLVTESRTALDRAIRALPITQHPRIWKLVLVFIRQLAPRETAIALFHRFLKVHPEKREEYISFLYDIHAWDEAAKQLSLCIDDDKFQSIENKTKYQLWMQLCDLLASHPEQVTSLRAEPIIRSGIGRYKEHTAKLWTSLAQYYIRLGQLDKARDIFEEAIDNVLTVRDFSTIWDAYTQFEDKLITAQYQLMEAGELEDTDAVDFDLRLARYENLLDRQPLLVNSVLLRQNPHNINEWLNRVKLIEDPTEILETYSRAIKTVDPQLATGDMWKLWVFMAQFYEENGELDSARQVFRNGTEGKFRYVNDLATVWCCWAELEIRAQRPEEALTILKQATVVPRRDPASGETGTTAQQRLHRSTKLWAMLADLEESVGTFFTCKAVYDKILELRIASPQLILNYAQFLETNKHFEESFRAYERGVNLFKFPYSYDIWIIYLNKFVARYKSKKLERARNLFEQVLGQAPVEQAKYFYIMYADLEEKYGLIRHAMSIYDRATSNVDPKDRYAIYLLYISRASQYFGLTKTREIFEKGIAELPDREVRDLCMHFAQLELRLGEIDRARAVYTHAAQFSDPKSSPSFYEAWRKFEVKHGNEDTFREMLRVKRSVQASFQTDVNFTASEILQAKDDMHRAELESEIGSTPRSGQTFLTPTTAPLAARLSAAPGPQFQSAGTFAVEESKTVNPEEMDLDLDGFEVQESAVPEAVFGDSLKRKAAQ